MWGQQDPYEGLYQDFLRKTHSEQACETIAACAMEATVPQTRRRDAKRGAYDLCSFPKTRATFLGAPHNEDYNIFGGLYGAPLLRETTMCFKCWCQVWGLI